VSYDANGVHYLRELFASHPDQVLVWHISADKPGKVSFSAKMDSPHKNSQRVASAKDQLALRGQVEEGGVRFESHLKVAAVGGRVLTNTDSITVENADSALLLLTAATSFNSYRDIGGDPAQRCEAVMRVAGTKTYENLVKAHLEDYQPLIRRVQFELGHLGEPGDQEAPQRAATNAPTDERLKRVSQEPDPQLETLYFQFGRYLLIASSRPGGQPANLQGLWNDQLKPPWDSKWTVNINTEMNYWPAEVCNLSECTEPLFDLIDECSVTGRKTAQAHYAARGWVLHHNTDIWRGTAPINASNHGIWVTGGAWLCHHLWEHYMFTGDKEFLKRRAYPVMKEAALFFTDFLVKDPRTGKLISGPSNSPEEHGLVMGPTMDHQIIRGLFANTAQAASVLGIDKDFSAHLTELRVQIAPNKIGQYGQLQEWLEDVDDPKNTHRHCSHLWAVYPGSEITPRDTPELCAAARQSLVFRGDGGTGWSKAWKISFWARFLEGDHAHKMLVEALAGNTFPNLFDAHPPFQIDGNFGGTAGIAEMLLQSHEQEGGTRVIELLPALPSAWPEGRVKGLRARGGFEIDLAWEEATLKQVSVHSLLGNPCVVRYRDKIARMSTNAGHSYLLDGGLELR
jgi:alpha-L-fucosidase 2